MTTAQELLDAVVADLLGARASEVPPVYATAAGNRVLSPGDWPTQQGQFPIIRARIVSEDKQSLGRGGINFTVIATIRITAEISTPVQVDNLGAAQGEQDLWSLVRQIECAIVNGRSLWAMIQQIASVRTQLSFTSDAATHLAGAAIDLALEYYQGLEDFDPPEEPGLLVTQIEDTAHAPLGLTIAIPQ